MTRLKHCVGCGDDGHTVRECPDETEGRRSQRYIAEKIAAFSLNMPRVRLIPSRDS